MSTKYGDGTSIFIEKPFLGDCLPTPKSDSKTLHPLNIKLAFQELSRISQYTFGGPNANTRWISTKEEEKFTCLFNGDYTIPGIKLVFQEFSRIFTYLNWRLFQGFQVCKIVGSLLK